MTVDSKKLADQVVYGANIPPVPATLQVILKSLDDPATSAAKVEEVILRDARLATEILRLANSSFYALKTHVSSLRQAVVLLGFAAVRNLALSLSVLDAFSHAPLPQQRYLKIVWRRSVLLGRLMQILATKESPEKKEELFLAGTLHHIGHVVLYRHFGDKYEPCLEKTYFPEPEQERKLVGTDHAEVGALLLERWMLPQSIIDFVRHHAAMDLRERERDFAYLKIADFLADQWIEFSRRISGDADEGLASFVAPLAPSLAKIGWTPEDFEANAVLFAGITTEEGQAAA